MEQIKEEKQFGRERERDKVALDIIWHEPSI